VVEQRRTTSCPRSVQVCSNRTTTIELTCVKSQRTSSTGYFYAQNFRSTLAKACLPVGKAGVFCYINTMSKYLEVGIEAAKNAEKIILEYLSPDIKISLKSDNSPVTIADQLAEKTIVETIKKIFPDHSFLGEELGQQNNNTEYTWIIDPIDGTKDYSRGIPLFGTLISLFHNNEVILGVSNLPLMKELMYAEKGKGAFVNRKPVSVSKVRNLEESYVTFGNFNYFVDKGYLDNLSNITRKARGRRGSGDCWMYHLLAQGKLEVIMEAKTNIWDIAAPSLIVTEAGGKVTDFDGNPIKKNTTNILASNGFLHEEILAELKRKR